MNESPTLVQKLSAEMLGTFVLVFFGVGAATVAGAALRSEFDDEGDFLSRFFQVDMVGVSLAFGLAVMVGVYAFGRISGGHFNPAVSIAAALSGRMPWREVLPYVVVQIVGSIVATGVLFVVLEGYSGFVAEGHMGANTYGDQGSGIAWWAAFLIEVVLTALFVVVILAVTDNRNDHPGLAPMAIGFALVACHLVGIAATGTSVNPARSIGPALFSGVDAIKQLWLFILAPTIGGALVGVGYHALFGRDREPEAGTGLRFGGRGKQPSYAGWQQPGGYPQQGSQHGYAPGYEQGYPQPAYPQPGPPQHGYPQQGYPQQGYGQPSGAPYGAAPQPEWDQQQWGGQGQNWNPPDQYQQQWGAPPAQAEAPQEPQESVEPDDSQTRIRPPEERS